MHFISDYTDKQLEDIKHKLSLSYTVPDTEQYYIEQKQLFAVLAEIERRKMLSNYKYLKIFCFVVVVVIFGIIADCSGKLERAEYKIEELEEKVEKLENEKSELENENNNLYNAIEKLENKINRIW